MTLDFIAIDLALYLNTHPTCRDGAHAFSEAVRAADKVRKEFERHFGPLRQECGVVNGVWEWHNEPWPWQKEANFCLRGLMKEGE
jgi:spore coat protein JB